mmetsp:Transcript_20496/g.45726  ORF Transcript_20496/g.45726 Transcript_20496/m.45726 type:complete len:245 (+) Transcript_20496:685-1419(+)
MHTCGTLARSHRTHIPTPCSMSIFMPMSMSCSISTTSRVVRHLILFGFHLLTATNTSSCHHRRNSPSITPSISSSMHPSVIHPPSPSMFRRPSPRPSIHLPIHLPIHLSPIHRSRYSRRPLLRSTCSRPPSRSHACRSSVAMRVATAPQVSHGPPPAHTHACTARTPHTSRSAGRLVTEGVRLRLRRSSELTSSGSGCLQSHNPTAPSDSLCVNRVHHTPLLLFINSRKKKEGKRITPNRLFEG